MHPLLCWFIYFSSFEHAKYLLIMNPNNTKNSSLKCDFLIFNYEQYQNLVFIEKNTKFDQKTVSLLCVKTQQRGPLTANIIITNEETFLQASALQSYPYGSNMHCRACIYRDLNYRNLWVNLHHAQLIEIFADTQRCKHNIILKWFSIS